MRDLPPTSAVPAYGLPESPVPRPIALSPHVTTYEERHGDGASIVQQSWYNNVILKRRSTMSDEVKASIIAAEIVLFGRRRTFD